VANAKVKAKAKAKLKAQALHPTKRIVAAP
jgi:hypothetical protein